VPLARQKGLDRYQSLAVGSFEFSHDLSERTDYSCHRQCEAVHASSCLVGVAHVMQMRIANRSTTFDAVELRAIVGDETSNRRCAASSNRERSFLPFHRRLST
jgi:hypothetical protein